MSGVGITYLWLGKEFPPFIRLEGKRGDYEVYTPERTCHDTDENDWHFVCSACGYEQNGYEQWNYCPNCGAKVIE